jgi:hypothetical protein
MTNSRTRRVLAVPTASWVVSFGSTLTQSFAPAAPRTSPDARAARRSLLDQVRRLEEESVGLFCSAWPRKGLDLPPARPPGAGPRLLSMGELEELRDGLVEQVGRGRAALGERGRAEEQKRRLIEQMLLDPESHRWVHVSNEDIGEPGCTHWHVRPRWGPLGMLMRWWRVVVSSGCP